MLPIGDDNSTRRTFPVVTYTLIVLNALVFMLELSSSDTAIVQWSFVPARFLANPLTDFVTIFSSMFMHAGWLHLGSNMLYLWIFGDNVEDRFGHFQFLIFYLLCGIGAMFAQMLFSLNSTVPTLGASGAIAGVLGAYLFLFPRQQVKVLLGYYISSVSAIIVIGLWIVLQLFSGIGSIASTAADSGGVAYMAHIGGFFIGLLLTFLFGRRRQPQLPA
jgi:membrane associated rhomboid family serine protease